MRKPDFFIVGAPKCGTTAMNDYLQQHPEIYLAKKEITFFGSDFHFLRPRPTEESYLSCFADAQSQTRIGESSVWYLYSREAAREIRRFSPSAKILVMLRNPVDMMYSLHSQLVYEGFEDILTFSDALAAESDRRRGVRIPTSAHLKRRYFCPDLLFYREVAKYTNQVKRYFDIFTRDNVHVIIFDDFVANTVATYRSALHFLGVNESFRPVIKIVNPNKRVRSIWLRRMLVNRPAILRWSRRLMGDEQRHKLRQRIMNLNVTNDRRPPMALNLRRSLQAEYAGELYRLSLLLGRDLTHWSEVPDHTNPVVARNPVSAI